MFTHIAVVRDLVDTQYKEYQEVSFHNTGHGVRHPWVRCLLSLKCQVLVHSKPHFSGSHQSSFLKLNVMYCIYK